MPSPATRRLAASIPVLLSAAAPAWAAGPIAAPLGAGDLAAVGLIFTLAAAALASSAVYLWRELRPERLVGPPHRSRLYAASIAAALAEAGFLALGVRDGLHLRVAMAWFGAAVPWTQFAPVVTLAGTAALSAGASLCWRYYRTNSALFRQEGPSARELASRVRLGIVLTLLGLPAALLAPHADSLFEGWGARPAAVAGIVLAVGIGLAEGLTKRRLALWDERPDEALLARAQRLGARVRRPIARAVTDRGGADPPNPDAAEPETPVLAVSLSGDCVHVSRHAAETMTEEELDFAIAYALALEASGVESTERCLNWISIGAGVGLGAIWLTRSNGSHLSAFCAVLPYMIFNLAAQRGAGWARQRADRTAAVRALDLTGDLETAESAIGKLSGGKLQGVAYSEARAAKCIARLRQSASDRGLIFARGRPVSR